MSVSIAGKRVRGPADTVGRPLVEGIVQGMHPTQVNHVLVQTDEGWVVGIHVAEAVVVTCALSIETLFNGDLNRLRYITRYSTSLVLHRENVAEHSYYVTLYAMLIVRWMRAQDDASVGDSFELEVLRRCIVHDIDECRTGDFQRPFKYSSPELQTLLEAGAHQEFEVALQGVFQDDPSFIDEWSKLWDNAKDDTKVGRVVAFADYLSVMSYLASEVSCANISVMQHWKSLYEYTDKFSGDKFNFLRPLVDQAVALFHHLITTSGIDINS